MPAPGRRLRGKVLFRAAALAALLASAGDLLMLLVANGHAPPWGSIGSYILAIGGILGVVTIPVYYIGYQAAASLLGLSPLRRRLCLFGAALVALFGAVTHALTALDIQAARVAGRDARPPAEAFTDPANPLFLAALIAAAGALIAVACLITAGFRSHANAIRQAILFNPIVATVILGAGAAVSQWTMAYIAPSAPNLAHVLFFALLARASGLQAKRT